MHRLNLNAGDGPGNTNRALEDLIEVSVRLDPNPPGRPAWDDTATEVLQRAILLSGVCQTEQFENSADVEVSANGELFQVVSTDIHTTFRVVVDLENPDFFPGGGHTSEWTAVGVDGAGNRSPVSETLTITYNPEPARLVPARFRGLPGETIQINTPADARGIRIRVYGLDGEMHRILDLTGGPRQFSADWNLKDSGGRDLLDGLYILNIETTLAAGEVQREREVVAIVRD